jgi:hypothetical protein
MTGARSQESHGSVWVHAGSGASASCSAYPDAAPILSIITGQMSLDITVRDRKKVTAAQAGFARELADNAARFAAECERLAAPHDHDHADCPAAGRDSAA